MTAVSRGSFRRPTGFITTARRLFATAGGTKGPIGSWRGTGPSTDRGARITGHAHRPAGLTQSGLAVTEGKTYRFTGFLRASGSVRVRVVLKSPLPDGRFDELASAHLAAPTENWSKLSAELRANGTSESTVFELRVDGKGSVWVDKLSLVPADNVAGWRTDVVDAIRDVHPALIRWGGSAVDPGRYRWKNGIGDRDHRVPFANTNWGRIDSNDVGIDEFCQFCAAWGPSRSFA